MSTIQGLLEVNGRTVGTFRIVPGVRYHGALACLVLNSLVYKTRSVVGMLDVQNFFHEALAVIIAKLYTRRKLSVSSIERYHFPVERPMCA